MLRERFDRELTRRLCRRSRCGAQAGVRSGTRGMTLIEIMVVIAIIGIVAGAIAYGVITYFKKSKVKAAAMEIKQKLQTAIQSYYMDEDVYPDSLEVLLDGPYGLKPDDLVDPWKKQYIYTPPASENEEMQICSGGPDGATGGEDDVCLVSRD